jgi:2-polyprenyl-3-methyl-5-hydroxy-6-metoxy-1,4-benzoquinol methylase
MIKSLVSFLTKKYPTVSLSENQRTLVDIYNLKVSNDRFEFEEIPCLCRHQEFKTIYDYDRYGLWNPVVICCKCGLIQNYPRLTEEEYQKFYTSDDYRYLYESSVSVKSFKERYTDNNHIFDELDPILKESGLTTILELGCGGGWNLIPFHRNGYDVSGIDYSPMLTELGSRTYGLNVKQGSIKSLSNASDKYDVIIINHVVEHFTDFYGLMGLITKRLNKGGVIYIGVPNMDNCAIGQLQNAHTYYFTPRTFLYFMEKCGLKKISFGSAQKIHMYGIFTISDNIELNQVYDTQVEYDHMIKKIGYSKFKYLVSLVLELIGIKQFVKRLISLF